MLDLDELIGQKARNLSGHLRGVEFRKHFKLDELDSSDKQIVVEVPDYLVSMTTSFFQGMFAESVNGLGGEDAFLRKYSFRADPFLLTQIQRGLDAVTTAR